MSKATVLVTGAAGFIGFHFCQRLLHDGQYQVVGLDNLNDYYDVSLKRDRLAHFDSIPDYKFVEGDLADRATLEKLFADHQFKYVVHLGAQAGVRYSLQNPHAYADSNLVGFLNILEGCRHQQVEHLVYASSSSVYGANDEVPFSVEHAVDHPVSLYAATKRANELMAHSYSHLFGMATTGLRFFTVYGPWGRPDMALFLFTRAILADEPIKVFAHGEMERDFTYVDDIVEGMYRLMDHVPQADEQSNVKMSPSRGAAPFRVFNIGNGRPVLLVRFIDLLEEALGKKAKREMLPTQPGEVPTTFADVTDLSNAVGYRPQVTLEEGIPRFVAWYREYYGA